jgi:ligand-binding SRPBCC domain-containing protein
VAKRDVRARRREPLVRQRAARACEVRVEEDEAAVGVAADVVVVARRWRHGAAQILHGVLSVTTCMSVHVHTLRREQRLPGSPDDVFAFFADARNLEAITPPLLRFRVMGPDVVMGVGALIRYRLRVHRVPVGWLTAIRAWDPPHRFVDEQLRGPYALWHHTHTFERHPDGDGTLMRDVVRYALPLGPVGEVARRLFVARDVEAIFDYRAARIRELLWCSLTTGPLA